MWVGSNSFTRSRRVDGAKSAPCSVRNITETFTQRVRYSVAVDFIRPQKGTSTVYCEELALLESQHFLHIGIIIEVEKHTFPCTAKHHSFLFGAVMKWS